MAKCFVIIVVTKIRDLSGLILMRLPTLMHCGAKMNALHWVKKFEVTAQTRSF